MSSHREWPRARRAGYRARSGGTAASMFLSRIASTQRSKSWRIRTGRAGLLDEVDGVPLALDRARLFLSRRRNSNLDDILTSALLAHPASAFDHHVGRIAIFHIEPPNLIEIQGGYFISRVAEAFSTRAPGILRRHNRLELAFAR